MPQDAKTYDLLIVGPADTEKYFVCIKRAIERFNTGVGKEKRIIIIGQELKGLIYAESGGKSDTLIRNQISEKIDLVTAIFWKSDDSLAAVPYLSTTEVIELALKLDKRIFTYFLENLRHQTGQHFHHIRQLLMLISQIFNIFNRHGINEKKAQDGIHPELFCPVDH